tara:strand:+ start:4523 stop:5467 length:945 start_codon:yes stop_codon:yes gene_type:complete
MNQDIEKMNLEVFSISKLYESYFLLTQENGKDRSYSVFHPSAFGRCLRRMQYQKYESEGMIETPRETVEPRMIRIWDTGHSMHDRWAKYAENLNILRGLWRCGDPKCKNVHGREDKLGIFKPDKCAKCGHKMLSYDEISARDDDVNFYGHVDQVLDFSKFNRNEFDKYDIPLKFSLSNLPTEPVLVDMKTINSNQWRKIKNDCHFYYRVQLVIYLHILDLPYGLLIYEKKDDSTLKTFRVDRNEEMWDVIKKQAKLMMEMVDKKMLPPPRPLVKRDMECNYCEYKEICHNSKVWDAVNLDELRKGFYEFDNFEE